MMKTACWKLALIGAATSTTFVFFAGGVASAHVDPDPLAMEAGTTATVAFNVEHGCDGSPMTDLKLQIPPGLTGVKPVDKAGWTATLVGDTVEFKGGPLPADQEDHFDITLTAPAQPGDLHFPAIETCEKGELDWIEIAAEGAPEPEFPAPTLKVTQGPPTSADLTPMPEETEAATGTGDTAAPLSATVAPSSSSSSNTGTIVVIVVVVAVVLVGGGIVLARRRSASN